MPEIKGGYVGIEPMLFLGNEAVINGVSARGPAARAGIQNGDLVLSVNQEPVSDWMDLSQKINEAGGKPVKLQIKRGDETLSMEIEPEYNNQMQRWVIGIIKDRQSGVPMTTVRYGIADAFVKGTQENLKLIGLTFAVLKRLFTFQLSYKVLGGPVIIAKASAAAAAAGISNFLYFLAFLSLQLSIINCLPIPVLDGGHLVFLGIEAIRRKPVSIRARQIASQVGFYVLIALMLIVTWNDLESVFGLKTLIKKIF
jgi:regulator of sigma E protease